MKLTIGHIFNELIMTFHSLSLVRFNDVSKFQVSSNPKRVKSEKLIQTLPTVVSKIHYPNALFV